MSGTQLQTCVRRIYVKQDLYPFSLGLMNPYPPFFLDSLGMVFVFIMTPFSFTLSGFLENPSFPRGIPVKGS